jgi:FkbM family methyltransferase
VRAELDQENEECALVLRHVQPQDRVVVFGAGFGAIQTFCAVKTGSENCIGYEPQSPAAWAAREITVRDKPLQVVEKAVVQEAGAGKVPFKATGNDWSRSGLLLGEVVGEVETAGINEALESHRATYFCMDVEGMERHLLPAISEENLSRLRGALIEIHPVVAGSVRQITRNFLKRSGLSLVHCEKNDWNGVSYIVVERVADYGKA